MNNDILVALIALAGALFGALVPSFVTFFNNKLNISIKNKQENEVFTRVFLVQYLPIIRMALDTLENMNLSAEGGLRRNRSLTNIIKLILKESDEILNNELKEIYPLEMRKDFSKLFTMELDLHLFAIKASDNDSYDIDNIVKLQKEIPKFIEGSRTLLDKLEKSIEKKYI